MKKPIFLTILQTALMGVCLSASTTANLDLSSWIDSPRDPSAIVYQTDHETPIDQLTGRHHIRTSNGFNSLEIKYDGKIHVSDDDRSIRSISPNGYLKIGYRTFGNKRELLINSNRSGNLSYEFYEGRKEIPFEPEGRVLRTLGEFDLDDPEIVDAYFQAVDHLSSNSEAGSVLRDLLKKNKVEGSAMVAFLNSCRKLSSDSETGSVLRSIQDLSLADARIREAYFNVIRTMSSDTESSRVLKHTLRCTRWTFLP